MTEQFHVLQIFQALQLLPISGYYQFFQIFQNPVVTTGVARNFDWKGQIGKNFVTLFW